jgi:hypothetical protein
MKKFFVNCLAIMACLVLVSGCTLPPEGDPPINYVIHMPNQTGYKLRFVENGYMKEGFIFPGQTKIFTMTVWPWREDIVYKIIAFRPGTYSGRDEIVATADIRVTVQAEDGYSVKSRIFYVTYEGGPNLIVRESGAGLFGW